MIKEILKNLDKNERIRLLSISFLTFFAILFELFGISLVIPISKLILDDNFFIQFTKRFESINYLKRINKDEFTLMIIALFITIYFFKTFFLSLLSYKKFGFIHRLIKDRSLKLYSIYLNQNIQFHKKNHSSELIKNLISEMNLLSAFYNSLIILFSEVLFTLIILIGIVVYNQYIFVFLVFFTLTLIFFYKIIFKNRIYNWGIERQKLQSEFTRDFLESFGAIREIIIYNKKRIFEKKIQKIYNKKIILDTRFATVNEIPKYFIELAALLGFLLLIVILYNSGIDKNELLVSLIFFSILLFKALPSASRIFNSIQQIKFYFPANKTIHDEILNRNNIDQHPNEIIEFKNTLDIKNLEFSYEEKKILKNFSLEIKKGQRVLVYGKSGKGKSTLIDIISGFYDNYNGKIYVDNKCIRGKINWGTKMGYLTQSFFILDDSILNNIVLNDNLDENRLSEVISVCQLNKIIDTKKNGVNTIIGERGGMLSGGEKQRIGLARALYRNPDILILDEPTSSLDDETANNFIDAVLKLDNKLTIIMVTHDKKFENKFDKIIKL